VAVTADPALMDLDRILLPLSEELGLALVAGVYGAVAMRDLETSLDPQTDESKINTFVETDHG
jgi:hypothetical protein